MKMLKNWKNEKKEKRMQKFFKHKKYLNASINMPLSMLIITRLEGCSN